MGINSTEVSYGFGQLGSAHIVANTDSLTPPDGMVIVAITFLANTQLDVLTAATDNSLVYGGTETNDCYFGIGSTGNENGNSGLVTNSVIFPKGLTIYGRWSAVSLNSGDSDGGILVYFGK